MMKRINRKDKPSFAFPKKVNACLISEFEVIHPTNDMEVVGEKLELSRFGEYCPANSLRWYSLLFLMDHSDHYRISKVVMNGIQYIIPADRKRNWLPKSHPEKSKFIVQ